MNKILIASCLIFFICAVECKEEKKYQNEKDNIKLLNDYPKDKTYPLNNGEGAVFTFYGNKTEEGVIYYCESGNAYFENKVINHTSKEYERFHIVYRQVYNVSRTKFENYTYYEGEGCVIDESSSYVWFDNKEAVTRLPKEIRDCGLEPAQYDFIQLKNRCNYRVECKSDNIYFFKIADNAITAYLTNDTEEIQIYDFNKFESYSARSYSDVQAIINFLSGPSASVMIIPSFVMIIGLLLLLVI